MIKINLLGQESVKDNSAALQISTAVGTLAIVLIASMLLLRSINNKIESTKQLVQQKELELSSLKKVTEEVRELEKKKAELKDKLLVIASLKSRKIGPVRVLDDLNLAMPEKSWLTEIKEVNGNLNIQGLALDNQTVATFMKGLEGSEYFSNIELSETRQAEWQKVVMKRFTLTARLKYAGKRELETKVEAQKKAALNPKLIVENETLKTTNNAQELEAQS